MSTSLGLGFGWSLKDMKAMRNDRNRHGNVDTMADFGFVKEQRKRADEMWDKL
jgi:hypothetical protein